MFYAPKYCWKLSIEITLALRGTDFGLFPKIETSLKEYMHSTINEFQKKVSKAITKVFSSMTAWLEPSPW